MTGGCHSLMGDSDNVEASDFLDGPEMVSIDPLTLEITKNWTICKKIILFVADSWNIWWL